MVRSRTSPAEPRVVNADGLGDLGADLHDRVESGHGLLKDHGDLAAAKTAHGWFGLSEEIAAAERNRSRDAGEGWQKAQQGQRGGGLSRAGLADQAECLARADREGDALHGRVRAEADAEVSHGEKRRHLR